MAEQHGQGQSSHSRSAAAWMDQHLGGFIMSFGEKAEQFFENTMFLIVNGLFLKAAWVFLAIIVPVILFELVVHTMGF